MLKTLAKLASTKNACIIGKKRLIINKGITTIPYNKI